MVTSSSSKSDPSRGEAGDEANTGEGIGRVVPLPAGSRAGELTGRLGTPTKVLAGGAGAATG